MVTPGATFSQGSAGSTPTVVLFNGKDFPNGKGKREVKWKIENDYMETTKTGRIHTKDEFGDFQLHLEFATPAKVEGNGRRRGNNAA
ncbi:MAG: family 16 glycoside hydrolase [Verrucomicrobiota bacterium]